MRKWIQYGNGKKRVDNVTLINRWIGERQPIYGNSFKDCKLPEKQISIYRYRNCYWGQVGNGMLHRLYKYNKSDDYIYYGNKSQYHWIKIA